MVVFEKCNSEVLGRACKDDSVINEWLKFKFIIALENERHFVQDSFGEDRVVGYSSVAWYAMTLLGQRNDYVKVVNLNDLVLNDSIFDFAKANMETD